MNRISPLLTAYRKFHKQTQKELVNELLQYTSSFKALNTVTLSRWETGTTSPSLNKKRLLLHFFANSQCLTADTIGYNIVKEAYKNLYEPLNAIFSRKYQYLIGNLPEHRTGQHTLEDLRSFSQKEEHIEHIIDIETATNTTNYYGLTPSILTQWCVLPSTFCVVAERKKQHLGHFIMLKIKNSIAEDIAHHRRSEFSLLEDDFCNTNEHGTYYVHGLYGRSPKIAAELNIKAYLHLFENMEYIDNVMIFSSRTDGLLLTKDYGIKTVAQGKDETYGFKWHGMLSPVEDILFSDAVIRHAF